MLLDPCGSRGRWRPSLLLTRERPIAGSDQPASALRGAIATMTEPLSPQYKVLLIAHDDAEREALGATLRTEGFMVDVQSPTDDLNNLHERIPDIVLLGVRSSKSAELDVCREIQRVAKVPVVVVSADRDETQVVLALELGAADYIAEPLRRREVVARLRAVLRRTGRQSIESFGAGMDPVPDDSLIIVGPVEIQLEARRVLVDGEEIELSRRDFDLLVVLASPPGKLRTREELVDRIWPESQLADTRALDKHIRRLRAKIEPISDQPRYLVTVHGVGFRFDDSHRFKRRDP